MMTSKGPTAKLVLCSLAAGLVAGFIELQADLPLGLAIAVVSIPLGVLAGLIAYHWGQ
jgi:hypothetical protein